MFDLKRLWSESKAVLRDGFFAMRDFWDRMRGRPHPKPWLQHYDHGVPHDIAVPNVPISYFLDQAVQKNSDAVFIRYFGRKMSYGNFYQLMLRFAAGLESLGVSPGDRVALVLPNVPQFPIAYWAAHRIGAVVVLINPLLSERELIEQLKISGARIAIVLDRISPRIFRSRQETDLRHVVIACIETYLPPFLRLAYEFKSRLEKNRERLRASDSALLFRDLYKDAEVRPMSIDPNQPAVMIFTGGVTGTPKAAVLTHRNLVANVLQGKCWMPDLREGREVILAVLPLIHSYGMTACHHFAVVMRATLILHPRFQVKQVIRDIRKYKVTIFPGVPTMYQALVDELGRRSIRLPSIRTCISGGSSLPLSLKKKFETLTGGKLVEGYGLSEASPITHCNPFHGENREGSIGLPWPGTEARVVDMEKRRPLGPNRYGELQVRGPQIMQCYWQQPDESEMVLSKDGWLSTGDIAYYDEAGYFYIVDRKKDVIFYGSYNIYPSEIEKVLLAHPQIKDVAVVGVKDEYYGEIVKAIIVLEKDAVVTFDEIVKFCQGKLAKFKIPREVEFTTQLPKNFLGKTLKRKLGADAVGAAVPAKASDGVT